MSVSHNVGSVKFVLSIALAEQVAIHLYNPGGWGEDRLRTQSMEISCNRFFRKLEHLSVLSSLPRPRERG